MMGTHVAVPITYNRVDGSALSPIAWVGRTAFRRNSPAETAGVVFSDRDFLIPVAELAESGGATFEPAEGDWIQEGDKKYRVSAPDGEPAVRYSDQTQKVWRIHTKLA